MPPSPAPAGPPVSRTHRWLPAVGAFLVGAIAYGGLYCFPPLSIVFADQFHASRTLAVTPWTVFLLVSGLCSPLLGRLYDVFLDRHLLTAGMLLLAAGWLLVTLAGDMGSLVLAYGIVLALGLELVFVGTTTAIARRYAGAAGAALGIAYAGPGIGVAVALPAVSALLTAADWRMVTAGFGAAAVAGLPFVWLMTSGPAILVPAARPAAARPPSPAATPPASAAPGAAPGEREPAATLSPSTDPPGSPLHETSAPGAIGAAQEQAPAGSHTRPDTLRRTLRTRRFWILFAGAVAIGVFDEGVFQTFLPQATGRGVSEALATQALGLQSLAYVAGQVVGGSLSDRLGRRSVGLGALLVAAGGVTLAFGATGATAALAVLGIVLHGAGTGTTIAVRSAAFSDVFGGPNFGAIFGVLAIAYPLGGMAAVYASGLSFDRLGNYWPVYGLALAGLACWAGALVIAGPRRHGRAAHAAP